MDTFERNLENTQLDYHIEPANFIPVVYKSEMEASNIIGALPTILLFGFLFWSFRGMSRMARGGMGGGTLIYFAYCSVAK